MLALPRQRAGVKIGGTAAMLGALCHSNKLQSYLLLLGDCSCGTEVRKTLGFRLFQFKLSPLAPT